MLRRISRGFVLRKAGGRLGGFDQLGLSARGAMSAHGAEGVSMLGVLGLVALVVLAVVMVLLAHPEIHFVAAVGSGVSMAFAVPATTRKGSTEPKKPAKIREMEANLKALATELEAGQVEMTAGYITPERGEELEQKAQEMEQIQGHLDQYNKIAKITTGARQVDRVTLPDEEGGRRKSLHTTPGHLFVMSDEFKQIQGQRSGWMTPIHVGARLGKKVRLMGERATAFEKKAYDAATLSDLGTDAIVQIDRDPEVVRFEEPELLTIRDMLNVVQTGSDTIKYVKHTVVERAAATVGRGALKPFLRVEFETAQTNVETIAVLSKVTEQDIQDAPRLVGLINGEMTLDVKVEEERQLAWGSGTNELLGLFDPDSGITEFNRSEAGDTTIDTIRRMRTDLRKVRVNPNFVSIDPLDWEEIELAKGSDERYIWGLIQDLRGPRIWSLRVIESDAMTNAETGERRILMGDGVRGATVYDRSQIELAVGFMDDDFGRNLRTLRAESRLAMAIKRAYAFKYAVTQEADS